MLIAKMYVSYAVFLLLVAAVKLTIQKSSNMSFGNFLFDIKVVCDGNLCLRKRDLKTNISPDNSSDLLLQALSQ